MKKYLFLAFSVLFLWSCKKNETLLNQSPSNKNLQNSMSIAEGKQYFDKLTVVPPKAARFKRSAIRMQPDWLKTTGGTNPNYRFLEVPITTKGRRVMQLVNSSEGIKESVLQQQLRSSFQTLVIFKSRRNAIRYRILTYVGSPEYLARHNKDISQNRISKLDEYFDGYINYSNIYGEFLFSIKIEHGKPVRKIDAKVRHKTSARPANARTECVETCEYWEVQNCFQTHETGPDGTVYEVTEVCVYEYELRNCFVDCYEVDDCIDAADPSGECEEPEPPCSDCPETGEGDNPGDTPTETFDYKKQMSPSEIAIFNTMDSLQKALYLTNAQLALNLARDGFPAAGLHNGHGDAFRHAFFSMANTHSLGVDLAKRLGDAHEEMPGNDPLEKQMDLLNNAVGRQAYHDYLAGGSSLSPGDYIKQLLTSGELFYIKDGKIETTNK